MARKHGAGGEYNEGKERGYGQGQEMSRRRDRFDLNTMNRFWRSFGVGEGCKGRESVGQWTVGATEGFRTKKRETLMASLRGRNARKKEKVILLPHSSFPIFERRRGRGSAGRWGLRETAALNTVTLPGSTGSRGERASSAC